MNRKVQARKVVIVGGVAGGANAAARLRRLDESLEIVVLERSGYVSFANCGLPYHIGNEIAERNKLLVHTPQSLHSRFAIDVRIKSEVTSINRNEKLVRVKDAVGGREYDESYDILILAPGTAPFRPKIEGIELPQIFSLRNIEDMDAIIAHLSLHLPKHVVIIGGGFIGIEMLEQLHKRFPEPPKLTLLEMNPHILSPLDFEMSAQIERHLKDRGVELICGDGAVAFEKNGDSIVAVTKSGKKLEADFVLFNIGVRPEVEFAKASGILLGDRGGIKVDSKLRTNDPSIFAVGDCIETPNFVTAEVGTTPLAGPANRQGRIVADVICGIDSSYKGSLGTAIVRAFDLVAAVTGVNERTLQRLKIPYRSVFLHPNSHAGYYPGAHPMHIKVIYSPNSKKILGAQAVGRDGVDKRIDVIATAIYAGLTVEELIDLELCYAPPFGSAKDAVNLAGMVAQNVENELVEIVTSNELKDQLADSLLLDVRSNQEREQGFIPGSIHIPLPELRARLGELSKAKPLIVYCHSGQRSYNACRILKQNGFKCKNLSGAFATWRELAH